MLRVAVVVLAACGSPTKPNIDGTKLLVDLTAAELDELCTYDAEVSGAPRTRTIQCGNGNTVTINSEDQCVSGAMGLPATCAATVNDDEACVEAVAEDPCGLGGSACAPLEACASM